jgi:hypothetical protein
MRKLGNPFLSGTLSYLLVNLLLFLVIAYFYLTSALQKPVYLLIVVLSAANVVRAYLKYIKFWNRGKEN